MSDFVIYALSVGGGTLALTPLPGSSGDYAADMAHLRDWQPALVISLTTQAEMVTAGAETLGWDIQGSGTRWISFPIKDFGIPSPDQTEAWQTASDAARAALSGGGRVLIHCRGGCGRSGMAVLGLMIEAGEDAGEALARLRSLRPCAIETPAQMAWALRR